MKVEMNDTRRYIEDVSMTNTRKVEARGVKVEKETPKLKEQPKEKMRK